MLKFKYIAKNKQGLIQKGHLDVTDRSEALKLLKDQGLNPLSLNPVKNPLFSGGSKIKLKERLIITEQLSVMVKAGLPLVEALQTLAEESDNKKISELLKKIGSDVKGGRSLSDAFEKTKAFPEYYLAVLRSGEKSGKLEDILYRLAQNLKRDSQMKKKLKNALILPIVIVIAMLAVVVLVLVFVLPNLMTMFTESNVDLPLPTRILMGASNLILNYWYILIAIITAIIFLVKMYTIRPSGRENLDKLKLKMPIFGTLIIKVSVARFAGTMATLISAGMPMLDIIETTAETMDNTIFKNGMMQTRSDVEGGKNLSDSIKNRAYFPTLVPHMIAIGEKSGNLEYIFTQMSNMYDDEAQDIAKNLMTMMEPLITVFLGLGVAFIMSAVISPIYKLINVI